jgi:RNA polymerase sigma-70 factor (ECF subfamily)
MSEIEITTDDDQGAVDSRPSVASELADADFIRELRAQMLKFATIQLNDTHLAEDAVQEALVGALKNVGSFNRHAALKTWVFAILKNKIADTLRRRNRLVAAEHLQHDGDYGEEIGELFNAKGFWHRDERPHEWSQPAEEIHNEQFWQVFEIFLDDLPNNHSRIFMMREFLEFDSKEVCESAGISVSNLHVMLYRARWRLRECLEKRWFLDGRDA